MKRKHVMLATSLLLLPMAAAWLAANQLAHPPRRPLQDYHREFLADPAAHGVRLQSFICSDGTPCLLCEPAPHARLGKRGQLIRDQMTQQGIPLSAPGSIVGNLVLVHGRRGRKEDYLLIAERFCAVGFRCILPDLPAHGDHPGTTALYGLKEWHIPALALRAAATKFGFDPHPAGLMGISMGGAVSIRALVKNELPWRAAALVSTFDTLDHVVRHQASSWVGASCGSALRGIAGSVFTAQTGMHIEAASSLALAPRLTCPVLVAHGTSDHVIPIDCGRRLYAALPATLEKRWVEIPGADHNNVLITAFPLYAGMAAWFLRHVPPNTPARP